VKVEIPSSEYEEACLQAVRRALLDDKRGLQRHGAVVHSVDLVLNGNDRRIVAPVTRRGAKHLVEWRLYEDVFSGVMPAGEAEDPEGVATQMFVWAIGG
jgi:hypothetical protein